MTLFSFLLVRFHLCQLSVFGFCSIYLYCFLSFLFTFPCCNILSWYLTIVTDLMGPVVFALSFCHFYVCIVKKKKSQFPTDMTETIHKVKE